MRHNRTALESFLLRKGAGRGAVFMPYVTAGYPSPGAMPGIFGMLADSGSDCIELGVPFSDPVADGPIIQASTLAALGAGVTPDSCFRMAEQAARKGLRVILMGYANPWMAMGLKNAARRMSDAGVHGVIVPDLPVEEAGPWQSVFSRRGLGFPLFAAPTTPVPRLRMIDRASSGFIYYVSVTGVTGERRSFQGGLGGRLSWMRANLESPVCVGFGVSTPAQVSSLAPLVSGVIVGSALVRRLSEWTQSAQNRLKIARWTRSMARASGAAIE